MQTATLGEHGIPGDRCWTLLDQQGAMKAGKKHAVLMSMRATLQDEPCPEQRSPHVTITLPDGRTVSSQDSTANATLSAVVGEQLSFCPLIDPELWSRFRRLPPPAESDPEASMRAVFARTEDEPLPDLSHFPKALFEYESPPGTFFDAYPLLIMSTAALACMTAQSDAAFDLRRFRPNLVVDTDSAGFPETQWVGQRLRIGEAELEVTTDCPRCVMVTHPVDELPKDPSVMRALVQHNGGNLGVYANVTRPGTIAVGDSVQLLS